MHVSKPWPYGRILKGWMNPFQRLLFFFNVIALELKTIFTDAINHNQIKFIFFRVQYYVTYYMEVVFIVYQSSNSTEKEIN